MKREFRFCTELRAEAIGDDMSLVGYGAVFNMESNEIKGKDFRFRETVAPSAFTRSLKEGANVACLFNHDENQVLGRTSSGTLTLAQDARGLAYRCLINREDPQALSTYAKIKRGDINSCS